MNYSDDQAIAKALLADAGQAVTLTAPAAGAYDTATGTVAPGTPSITVTTGVMLPLSRGLKHMPGTDIQAGDQQLLLPGDIAAPAIDTKATIGGLDYVIKEVTPLNPGGVALLHDCVIRR